MKEHIICNLSVEFATEPKKRSAGSNPLFFRILTKSELLDLDLAPHHLAGAALKADTAAGVLGVANIDGLLAVETDDQIVDAGLDLHHVPLAARHRHRIDGRTRHVDDRARAVRLVGT